MYMDIATLLVELERYIERPEELSLVKVAFQIASLAHQNQMRESGEPYITHPLEVAHILATMHQDTDTICAGLLHDVIEDTDYTKESLAEELKQLHGHFFPDERYQNIVHLVDGVTKVKQENYDTKIIKATLEDERTIMIKLADRLHNMRTLQFKKDIAKRKKIALKTFNQFVPWAKYLGAYKIKYELEDLCFQILSPDIYQKLKQFQSVIYETAIFDLNQRMKELDHVFLEKQIYYYPKVKDVYGIYKSGYPPLDTDQKKQITEEMLTDETVLKNVYQTYKTIPELVQLKIIVDTKEDCYEIGDYLSKQNAFSLLPNSYYDYIQYPKKNMYQSLDFILNELWLPIQYQIRTNQMDLKNCYGNLYHEDTKNKIDFVSRLQKLIDTCSNDTEILNCFKKLATTKICVTTLSGEKILMDPGNTVTDFAARIASTLPARMNQAYVNGVAVRKDHVLEDGDVVLIKTKEVEPTKNIKVGYQKQKVE